MKKDAGLRPQPRSHKHSSSCHIDKSNIKYAHPRGSRDSREGSKDDEGLRVGALLGGRYGQARHRRPRVYSDGSAKPALVLPLSSPICVMSAAAGQTTRQQTSVSAVQIVDAMPAENARVQLTGKLVTGNTSAYYAVPTAIWVLKQRELSAQ